MERERMRKSGEVHQEIIELEEELKRRRQQPERRVIQEQIKILEKELYGIKQREYVSYSLIDEKVYNERMSWLEESKRIMRKGRERNVYTMLIKGQ